MRTTFVATAVLCLVLAATLAGAADTPVQSVELNVTRAPGVLHVTAAGRSEAPLAGPVMRFVTLPAGATDVRLEFAGDAEGDGIDVVATDPMTLRGVRILPVVIAPTAAENGSAAALTAPVEFEVEFDIHYSGDGTQVTAPPPVAHSRGFFQSVLDYFPENERDQFLHGTEGGYAIITAPEFASEVEPLAAWKHEMGFVVTVATTDEIGVGHEDVKDYIQDLYDNAEVPPQYLLLVGDLEQIPAPFYHSSVTDHPYAMLDGQDFLPDLHVGRLAVSTAEEASTIIAKILRYERDPWREDPDWFSRGLVVGGNSGSSTPVPVSRWCREQMLDIGYAEVDSVYYPAAPGDPPPIPPFITAAVDRGVSLITYRGWAYGAEGWHRPTYGVDHIPGQANGWMTPAVFSFVCHNNEFDRPICFGEAWIRGGTATEPKGGIAFIGNSAPWSHTRMNDAAAIGAFKGIGVNGLRGLGDILVAAKASIMNEFATQFYYDDMCGGEICADHSVEYYYYVYNLLGDPSMEIWMDLPDSLTVTHASSIPSGSTLLEVTVENATGGAPVEGARVGVVQGTELLGTGWSDAAGLARIIADFDDAGGPVTVTATGRGLLPYQGTATVASGGAFLAYDAASLVVVDDDSGASQGNGDGDANPNETLELTFELDNLGGLTAAGISATLSAGTGATILTGTVAYPDIGPGSSAANVDPFVVQIDATAADGLLVEFRLEATSASGTSVAGFDLSVRAAGLAHASHALDGDGILDPDETSQLTVTIQNDGRLIARDVQATLRSITPALATVGDSTTTFTLVGMGGQATATTPFTITAPASAAIGQAAGFTLSLVTDEGQVLETSLSTVVGRPDHRAPLGPDAYGYYAYDNSDTDYPDATPVFDWVNASSAYNGNGTRLELDNNTTMTVALPFSFTYYGQSYDHLLVCDNGWASFDLTPYYDFYNWSLPSAYGNGALLAPFWDNLDPEKEEGGERVGDGVYALDDSENGRFVVEWSRLANFMSIDPGGTNYSDLQTFELILYDPATYPTPTGDGVIRFQYKQVVNSDSTRMFATVGIESPDETTGLQYTYDNTYVAATAPLSAGLAIEFSTRPPTYNPFHLARFSAVPTASAVLLSWEPCDDRPRRGYRVYRATADDDFELVEAGRLGADAREFLDTTADPGKAYTYRIGALDQMSAEALLGPYAYAGSAAPALEFGLRSTGPNPFRGAALLSYALPARTEASVSIYTVTGRLVRTLIEGDQLPGIWTIPWDGRDQQGRDLPSGIYFGRLQAGAEQRGIKLTLVR